MKDKRAQGLPITTIIIAILGLVVLVILFAITTGRLAIFGRGVSECAGTCVYQSLPQGKELPVNSVGISQRSDGKCISDIEKQLVGVYIASGYAPGTTADKIMQCSSCCVKLA